MLVLNPAFLYNSSLSNDERVNSRRAPDFSITRMIGMISIKSIVVVSYHGFKSIFIRMLLISMLSESNVYLCSTKNVVADEKPTTKE